MHNYVSKPISLLLVAQPTSNKDMPFELSFFFRVTLVQANLRAHNLASLI